MPRHVRVFLLPVLTLLSALLGVVVTSTPVEAVPAAAPPNVLVVVTDDQRLETLQGMPQTRAWLAGDGVAYPNAIAATPVCCPARGSVLTGKYTHNHNVRTLSDAGNLDEAQTLPRRLRDEGYATAMAGKYLNGWSVCTRPPLSFERFAIFGGGYYGLTLRIDQQTISSMPNEPASASACGHVDERIRLTGYTTHTVGDYGRHFLDEFEADDERPWLLYLAPTAPHANATPEPKYADAPVPAFQANPSIDEADQGDKPPHVRDRTRGMWRYSASQRELRADMYRTLLSVDDMMAGLEDRLRQLGELDNTLVVFTSDNGWMWGDNHLKGKREAYEASLRVPFLGSLPGRLDGGGTDRRLVTLADIAATVYDAAAIDPGYVVDGQSLLGASTRRRVLVEHFAGGAHSSRDSTYAGWWSPTTMYRQNSYTAAGTDQGSAGCFDDRPRTICQRYAAGLGKSELYDTATDPGQLENLLARGASNSAAAELSSLVAGARSCAGEGCAHLEAEPVGPLPGEVARLTMTGPPTPRAGSNQRYQVTLTNTSGRRLERVRLVVEANDYWVATPLTGTSMAALAPGATFTATWRLQFRGTGHANVSAEAGFVRLGTWRRANGMVRVAPVD